MNGLLLVGFGGPEPGCCQRRSDCPGTPGCEAPCFVAKILGDDPRQQARVDEVVAHYRHFGGVSPYNRLTRNQAAALEAATGMPTAVGFRHWTPWIADGLRELGRRGVDTCQAVILAPHQGQRSWDDYLDLIDQAAATAGETGARVTGHLQPIASLPGFDSALEARLQETIGDWTPDRRRRAALVTTAHAIPQPAERSSPYRAQVETTAERLFASKAATDFARNILAFQSAPSASRVPWSQPDLDRVLAELAADPTINEVVIQPIGFLVDHVEVLFDLDTEARAHCIGLGLGMTRVPCLGDHPRFIAVLAEAVT